MLSVLLVGVESRLFGEAALSNVFFALLIPQRSCPNTTGGDHPRGRGRSPNKYVYTCLCVVGGGAMRSNNIFFYKFPIRASQHLSQKFPIFIKSLYTKDRNSVIINVNIIYYIRLIIILNSRFLNCFSYFFIKV